MKNNKASSSAAALAAFMLGTAAFGGSALAAETPQSGNAVTETDQTQILEGLITQAMTSKKPWDQVRQITALVEADKTQAADAIKGLGRVLDKTAGSGYEMNFIYGIARILETNPEQEELAYKTIRPAFIQAKHLLHSEDEQLRMRGAEIIMATIRNFSDWKQDGITAMMEYIYRMEDIEDNGREFRNATDLLDDIMGNKQAAGIILEAFKPMVDSNSPAHRYFATKILLELGANLSNEHIANDVLEAVRPYLTDTQNNIRSDRYRHSDMERLVIMTGYVGQVHESAADNALRLHKEFIAAGSQDDFFSGLAVREIAEIGAAQEKVRTEVVGYLQSLADTPLAERAADGLVHIASETGEFAQEAYDFYENRMDVDNARALHNMAIAAHSDSTLLPDLMTAFGEAAASQPDLMVRHLSPQRRVSLSQLVSELAVYHPEILPEAQDILQSTAHHFADAADGEALEEIGQQLQRISRVMTGEQERPKTSYILSP